MRGGDGVYTICGTMTDVHTFSTLGGNNFVDFVSRTQIHYGYHVISTYRREDF